MAKPFMLAILDQSDEEFNRMMESFQANTLVVAVYCGALLAGQIHGGEAVDAVGNATPMAAVRALHHEIG